MFFLHLKGIWKVTILYVERPFHFQKLSEEVYLRGRWFQTCQAYRLHVQRLLGSETSLQNLVSGTQIWLEVLPRKLTWNMKIIPLKRKSIFQTSIFGFHVSFRGCIVFFFFQRFWVWVILRLRWRDFSNCKLAIAILCLNEKLAIEWFWLNDVEVDSPALLFPFFFWVVVGCFFQPWRMHRLCRCEWWFHMGSSLSPMSRFTLISGSGKRKVDALPLHTRGSG